MARVMLLRFVRPVALVAAAAMVLGPHAWGPAAAQTVSPPDVGMHAAHPQLCGRCVENVDGAGEIRHYA